MPQVRGVGAEPRECGGDLQGERESLLDDQRLDLTRDIDHERTQRERLTMHVEAPRRELREIEHLVHQRLQMFCGGLDALHGADHPRTELAV